MNEPRQIIKAINRWVRKTKPFVGGMTFGVDFNTWCATFPQVSAVYHNQAKILTGRNGRFMPRFN